ncbi:hypothetical protein KKH38_00095, partial [Patescibacteria group bacterium]|nr:hypothetical protein [Patescibacteria group bacterium]
DLVKWDNQWYTQKELEEKFPPQEYDVPAKNTPEQVYTKFRQALLDNDIELALEQIREEQKSRYKQIFNDLSILGEYRKFPEVSEIKKSEQETYGNFTSYYFKFITNEREIDYSIQFEKDQEGYWKIDQI